MFEDKYTDQISLINVKDRGGLIQPPKHVTDICHVAESTFRLLMKLPVMPHNSHKIICTQALGYILNRGIQNKFSCSIHACGIIKEIISRFTCIRLKHEVKRDVGPVIRSKYTRLAIFSHV